MMLIFQQMTEVLDENKIIVTTRCIDMLGVTSAYVHIYVPFLYHYSIFISFFKSCFCCLMGFLKQFYGTNIAEYARLFYTASDDCGFLHQTLWFCNVLKSNN